jgi:tetratricopeptide (TPR) repeat protein
MAAMKSLIRSKCPVIYPVFSSPAVCYGFDERRARLQTYWFSRLSRQSRTREPSARDIVSPDSLRAKPSDRVARMAFECRFDRNLKQLDSLLYIYSEPVIMVIHPDSLSRAVAQSAGMTVGKLDSLSEAYRSIFIGLDYIDKHNPQKALAWFSRARSYGAGPFASYAEYLSLHLWQQQRTSVLGNLRLDRYLAPLAGYNECFSSPKSRRHLDSCAAQFEQACATGVLPAPISVRYLDQIPLSSAVQRKAGIAWVVRELRINPANSNRWRWLYTAAAWDGNTTLQEQACSSYAALNPDQFRMRLSDARLLVRLGKVDKVENTLSSLAPDSLRTDPDYLFCLGACAERKGRTAEAARRYRDCCAMRRYDPESFEAHARVLKKLGRPVEAEKALAWSGMIKTSSEQPLTKATDEYPGK